MKALLIKDFIKKKYFCNHNIGTIMIIHLSEVGLLLLQHFKKGFHIASKSSRNDKLSETSLKNLK